MMGTTMVSGWVERNVSIVWLNWEKLRNWKRSDWDLLAIKFRLFWAIERDSESPSFCALAAILAATLCWTIGSLR